MVAMVYFSASLTFSFDDLLRACLIALTAAWAAIAAPVGDQAVHADAVGGALDAADPGA